MVLLGQKLLYSDKMVVIGQGCCIWAKEDVFGQKWLYSGKRGCIRVKVIVFRQIGSVRAKLLYSCKVVVFGQKWLYSVKNGCIGAEWFCSGKNGCIRAKWLYLDKVVVFRQSGSIWVRLFYSGKVVVFG